MHPAILFHEIQRPNRWILLAFTPVVTVSAWGLYHILFRGSLHPSLTILCLTVLLIALLILSSSMTTTLDQTGIHVRCFPYGKRFIPWSTIRHAEVRRFDSFIEFGETGTKLRRRFGRNGIEGYWMQGDTCLRIHTDAEKILIGTGKPKVFWTRLKYWGKLTLSKLKSGT